MNRNVSIATAVGVAIIIGVIAYQINDTTYHVSTPEEYVKSMRNFRKQTWDNYELFMIKFVICS